MNISNSSTDGENTASKILNKVPQITILFWIIKILTTGMGEVMSDFLTSLGSPQRRLAGSSSGVGQAAAGAGQAPMGSLPNMGSQSAFGMSSRMLIPMAIVGVILIITMVIQIRSRRYVAWKYWLNVSVVAIFGTIAADIVHIGFVQSTIMYLIILAVILITWFIVERTLSVHSINTLRRELFYWATVLATFAMGTALGDMTATNLDLGTLVSGFMFVGLIAIPAIAYKVFHANEIFCFWFAYIITRPLGASFADWMSDGREGLGWGKGYVSLGLTVIIIALVVFQVIRDKKKNTTGKQINKGISLHNLPAKNS